MATSPVLSDPNSFSKPENASTTHIDLDWTVSFSEKTISGSALLHININDNSVGHLLLDSNRLNISKVICEESGQALHFEVGEFDKSFGSKVTISLPSGKPSKKLLVRIFYSTSPSSNGLQWLSPSQTSGKKHPFMFSQCQPIHARSIMPCQDTPRVKATYSAVVKCRSSYVVLMSALQQESSDGEETEMTSFKFHQPVAIPSYLLAIAVGDLVCEDVGPRSRVWAEKEVVHQAAHEFAETEKMLATAEALCGEYVWSQYDLLVLPPTFPYGGMENPCLTFVTPTLLAGDRSLADVIAHEICHSWTGNLVTNCSWEHFWLNEGFTVFVERKIQQRLHGNGARHLSALEGWNQLKYCISTRGSSDPLTCLIPKLDGIDPDDAFSSVPYEKGHAFLWYLEELVGGQEEFEPFLKVYLKKFSHMSIDSDTFKNFFLDYFANKSTTLKSIDWEAWFNTPGMPPYQPKFDTALADECNKLCDSWKDWDGADPLPFTSKDLDIFSSNQIILWLSQILEAKLPLETVKVMDSVYELSKSTNSEIQFRWLRLCLQARWEEKVEDALRFVNSLGRLKFISPIYKDLYEWEAVREKAVANFMSKKDSMMYMSVHKVSKDLQLSR